MFKMQRSVSLSTLNSIKKSICDAVTLYRSESHDNEDTLMPKLKEFLQLEKEIAPLSVHYSSKQGLWILVEYFIDKFKLKNLKILFVINQVYIFYVLLLFNYKYNLELIRCSSKMFSTNLSIPLNNVTLTETNLFSDHDAVLGCLYNLSTFQSPNNIKSWLEMANWNFKLGRKHVDDTVFVFIYYCV